LRLRKAKSEIYLRAVWASIFMPSAWRKLETNPLCERVPAETHPRSISGRACRRTLALSSSQTSNPLNHILTPLKVSRGHSTRLQRRVFVARPADLGAGSQAKDAMPPRLLACLPFALGRLATTNLDSASIRHHTNGDSVGSFRLIIAGHCSLVAIWRSAVDRTFLRRYRSDPDVCPLYRPVSTGV
jgi:hypothetical protein